MVARPWTGQGWNPYSYVENSPLSRTDPTGYCFTAGPLCDAGRGLTGGSGGGFTAVSMALRIRNLSFEVPLYFNVRWGASASISVGASVSLFDDEEDSDASVFGGWEPGYNRPYVTIGVGPPFFVWWESERNGALGVPEQGEADEPMDWYGSGFALNYVLPGLHGYGYVSREICRVGEDGCTHDALVRAINEVGVHPNQTMPFVPGEPYVGDVDLPYVLGKDEVSTVAIYSGGRQVGVENTTMENHELDPGTVYREVILHDGGYRVRTREGLIKSIVAE